MCALLAVVPWLGQRLYIQTKDETEEDDTGGHRQRASAWMPNLVGVDA